jgi:hypothetical protein
VPAEYHPCEQELLLSLSLLYAQIAYASLFDIFHTTHLLQGGELPLSQS